VKLKGFGTFKLINVDARESINVNTGERFTIQEHNKIGFIPETELRNLLNEPLSHLETVVLENVDEKENIPIQKHAEDISVQTHTEDIPVQTHTEDIPVQTHTHQESKEKNEETLYKYKNPAPKKKLPAFITCGIIAILLSGSIILYVISGDGEPQKKTALPTTTIINDTTEIPPIDIYTAEEDLRILNDTSPVHPDSVNYIITGTKTTYTVKKGETLTKVSLRFYGTKDLWPYIQKHNHSKIKNSGKIALGMILTIPELKKKEE
ncbi:hypothetical protein EZS27_018459, partial [termite gut metagenome]